MADLKRRVLNFLISLDQFLFNIVTLGDSNPDETASAAAWRLEQEGRLAGKIFRPLIDWLFSRLEKQHCYLSWMTEVNNAITVLNRHELLQADK